jgi:hypothetical protein
VGVANEAGRDRARDLAFAEALLGLSRVAATLSTRLRAVHADEPFANGRADAGVETTRPVLPVVGPRLGPRQLRVLEIAGLDSELGLAAADVATEAGLTAPNATVALKRLAELGYLVQVADQRPARWRRT